MMKILKASAGSGKTFALAQTYLDILLSSGDPQAYRHILAVTFTNKATAEMKDRILRFLRENAGKDPKALQILTDILHDYSSFAVSTIDAFFQQTIKAFSREIGQFADYQIELDRKSVIQEAMDRILDSLSEDNADVVDWIRTNIEDSLQKGEHIKIEKDLYDMGMKLKSHDFGDLVKSCGTDISKAYSKDSLRAIRKACRTITDGFASVAKQNGLDVKAGTCCDALKVGFRKANPEFAEYFDSNVKAYNTACTISKLISGLGLSHEFFNSFDEILTEKNIMCLDESNEMLRSIIDGSDAPFIYEKIGIRFKDFLLDEFQDTSSLQWENFYPLLLESESRGGRNLIVGDIKQSIYRWRNSDWTLLGSTVGKCFPSATVIPMEFNWRSSPCIVDFNSRFFEFASRQLGLEKMYEDVNQKAKTKDRQQGFVKISFCDKGDQNQMVLESVRNALDAGARFGDIAILVRTRDTGAEIGGYLIDNGIPVLSDDSLSVKSSIVVRRLVSLLSTVDNPADKLNAYLAATLQVEIPEKYHSVVDLCEYFLRALEKADSESYRGETLYIQAFMDDVQDWCSLYGNNLRAYLKHWNDKDDMFVGTPESDSSVRILTIHKSKGLEFPYVIFPYAESVKLYKGDNHWCHLDAAACNMPPETDNLYPVSLDSKRSKLNYFNDDYEKEAFAQKVDSINLFYVALTRAEKSLHVISANITRKCSDAISKGKPHDWTTMSELLHAFIGVCDEISFGEPYDFTLMERPSACGEGSFPSAYPSFGIGDRLKPSADALDFFGPEGVGVEASPRLSGIALHKILEGVGCAGDLPLAVKAVVRDSILTSSQGESALELLAQRIETHPQWFPQSEGGQNPRVLNETAIIAPDGNRYRPDRVLLYPDGSVCVIDYKFGEHRDSYQRQVLQYVRLYKKLGYRKVTGYVWYVREDFLSEVCDDPGNGIN